MGQQQLLLLVLGIVIVGLAVVVGIQAFGENQKKSNADAMVNDGVRIASDAQAWALKPAAFGGGAGVFVGVNFQALGYETDGSGNYINLNGTFSLAEAGAVTIHGCSADQYGANDVFNDITVVVSGTSPADITTTVTTETACTP